MVKSYRRASITRTTARSNVFGCQHPLLCSGCWPLGNIPHSDRLSSTSRVRRKPFAKKRTPMRCTILRDSVNLLWHPGLRYIREPEKENRKENVGDFEIDYFLSLYSVCVRSRLAVWLRSMAWVTSWVALVWLVNHGLAGSC